MLIEIMAIYTIWINVYLIFVNYLLCGKVNFLKLNQAFRQIVFVSNFMAYINLTEIVTEIISSKQLKCCSYWNNANYYSSIPCL